MRYFLLISALALLWGLVSCAQQPAVPPTAPPAVSQLSPTFTATPTQTATSAPSLTPSATPTITPSTTPDRVATALARPTKTPTVTPTPLPLPPLTIRQPTPAELNSYFHAFPFEQLKQEPYMGNVIEQTYADVNGDGETDLVVSDYLLLAIFLWQGEQYTPALVYQGYSWKYDPGSRVTLADWTNDQIPEIVFDFREDTGGTGVKSTVWRKFVISCPIQQFTCRVIWADNIYYVAEVYAGATEQMHKTIKLSHPAGGQHTLEVTSSSFGVGPWVSAPSPTGSIVGGNVLTFYTGKPDTENSYIYHPEPWQVYTSTVDIYLWNGTQFAWQESKILEKATYISSPSVLKISNKRGQTAFLTAIPQYDATTYADFCQLHLGYQYIGPMFPCQSNLTRLSWQDVTGDGREEILVYETSSSHLIIYQEQNGQFVLLTKINGYLAPPDLYGVRLEDLDQDGQVEIIMAGYRLTGTPCHSGVSFAEQSPRSENCWYEPGYTEDVFQWDGSQFVYSYTIPAEPE